MARRSYSDEEKAETLALLKANGGNVKRTAREKGIPYKTVEAWVRRGNLESLAEGVQEQKEDELEVVLGRIALKAARRADERIPKESAKVAMIALGIAIEKLQLLKGQPTSIERVDLSNIPPDHLRALAEQAYTAQSPSLPVGVETEVPQVVVQETGGATSAASTGDPNGSSVTEAHPPTTLTKNEEA